ALRTPKRPGDSMIDIPALRAQFPALQRRPDGPTPIFLDGPGGTQTPRCVIDAIVHYLSTCNANHGGVFATSRQSDEILHGAHAAVADFLNAPSLDEVIFGPNMTTLTFQLSRVLAQTWKPGDEIMVTRLDHDANVRPWVLAARDAGAAVRWIDIHPEDCTLDLETARRQLGARTRLLAVGAASNAVGTINDVATLVRWAHDAGALTFVDAVHFAPHGPTDVQAWGCDFLAFSPYKVFGPHAGVLWGRRALLEEMPGYKLMPASDALPHRWMTGTQNHQAIAGVAAAIQCLGEIGGPQHSANRRARLRTAMTAIQHYERDLATRLLAGLAKCPHFKVWGITDQRRVDERVPTISITHPRHDAQ